MLTPSQLNAIEAAAEAAIGRKEMRCQVAMADIYKDAGLLPADVEIPDGPRDSARFSGRSLILEWLEGSPQFMPRFRCSENRGHTPGGEHAATVPAQPGDLLVFRLGHAPHHVAILLGGGRLVHVFGEHGVQIAPCIPTPWAKRIDSAWILHLPTPISDLPSPTTGGGE